MISEVSTFATEHGVPDKVLIGLIGADIQRSKSPYLHEQEAAALGFKLHYQLIDLSRIGKGVEALPELLAAAEACGFAGVNITHPCKQAVIPYLDELSEDARQIGAVNTVVFRDGKRYGHNTDWSGFAEPFRRHFADDDLRRVAQARHERGQQGVALKVVGGDGEGGLPARRIEGLALGKTLQVTQQFPGPLGQRQGARRGHDAASGLGEERITGDAAQFVQQVADGRLGHAQALRRGRDGAGVDHRHQQTQQPCVQIQPI